MGAIETSTHPDTSAIALCWVLAYTFAWIGAVVNLNVVGALIWVVIAVRFVWRML